MSDEHAEPDERLETAETAETVETVPGTGIGDEAYQARQRAKWRSVTRTFLPLGVDGNYLDGVKRAWVRLYEQHQQLQAGHITEEVYRARLDQALEEAMKSLSTAEQLANTPLRDRLRGEINTLLQQMPWNNAKPV